MSDSEDENCKISDFKDIADEIEKCKKNEETSKMFVSGWDDADQNVDIVEDPKGDPNTYILWAAENGELDIIKELLTTQPRLIHVKDHDGYTPLHRAVYNNHINVISFLISVGANINAKTEYGWTPLHSACNWNNYLPVARLLAAGADPAAVSHGEQTPLHLASAISHCKSTLLILLLREDAVEIYRRPNSTQETPEQLASSHGIYSPLFEMALPAISYIRSLAFTSNPYVRSDDNTLKL